ncbi:MAG: GTP-binding protein [Clostridia bacterium]|nr:GTP-binding protein [Clostridia bacterium]
MTKIDIFSGFLGAGKTTLIKKLIAEAYAGQKIVLIENEFGEIGIDGAFLQDAGIQITEMNSGCICCTLVGDFAKALKKVLAEYAPDHILIEPSGVGKLSDVKAAIGSVLNDDVQLGGCVTVVDAKKAKVYHKNFGEFFNDQIESAGCIILSRTQDLPQDKLDAALALIKEHNADAVVIAAPWDQLTGADILAAMEHRNSLDSDLAALAAEHEKEHHHHHHYDENGVCSCGHHHDDDDDEDEEEHEHHHHHHDEDEEEHEHHHHHHHDHDADEIFQSWGLETMHRFTEDELSAKIAKLDDEATYGAVLRAKGVVPASEGAWIHFDHVPGEVEIRRGAAGVIGRLCVIGSKLNESALKALFTE